MVSVVRDTDNRILQLSPIELIRKYKAQKTKYFAGNHLLMISTKESGDKKTLLVVSFSETRRDPRVLKEVLALRDHFQVYVAGFGDDPNLDVKHVRLSDSDRPFGIFSPGKWREKLEFLLCSMKMYSLYYWGLKSDVRALKRLLKSTRFDGILINEPEPIPVVLKFAGPDTVVVHDQGEYWPELFISRIRRWGVRGYRLWIFTKYVTQIRNWTVVGEAIGREHEVNIGLPKPTVITNASRYENLLPSPVDSRNIELVYQGLWTPGRGIGEIVEALSLSDSRFKLNLLLLNAPTKELYDQVKRLGVQDRVYFHPPVDQGQVSKFINQFDVELIFIQPVNKNFELALPNKLFEAIQGRLAVITAPLPEVARLVTEEKIGEVTQGFKAEDLAATLNALTKKKIESYKRQTNKAAKKHNSEENAKKLVSVLTDAFLGQQER